VTETADAGAVALDETPAAPSPSAPSAPAYVVAAGK
jgi:hypothetical protein